MAKGTDRIDAVDPSSDGRVRWVEQSRVDMMRSYAETPTAPASSF